MVSQTLTREEWIKAHLMVQVGCPIKPINRTARSCREACLFWITSRPIAGWYMLLSCESELIELIRKEDNDYDKEKDEWD